MIFQSQTHSLRPLTTAHLAQTMTLLELNSDQLRQKIEGELANNPALEVVDEFRCPGCGRSLAAPGLCRICNHSQESYSESPIIFISPYGDHHTGGLLKSDAEESADEWNAFVDDLPTYLLRQIAFELQPEDRPIAAHILTSLDEDGLLRIPLVEIARYHHVPLSRIERVVRLLQKVEPIGVASSTPQEALLIQLDVLSESNAARCVESPNLSGSRNLENIYDLARKAILECMDLLSKRAYNEMARRLGIPPQDANQIANFISENLNPYPARSHWGDIHQTAEARRLYLTPDIVISYLVDEENRMNTDVHIGPSAKTLVVEILTPYAGSLRVNPLFKEAIHQAPVDQTESWQSHLDQANLLVKCMQQRNNTMVRLMEQLVQVQRNFIIEGDAYLVPITRAQLADKLGVHESTISRAVSGKAVQLPNKRIILLDKFFDRSLQIRTALHEIIAAETRPLSDTELAKKLDQQGFPIARRTVAKYRAMEGILPARFRHKDPNKRAQPLSSGSFQKVIHD